MKQLDNLTFFTFWASEIQMITAIFMNNETFYIDNLVNTGRCSSNIIPKINILIGKF